MLLDKSGHLMKRLSCELYVIACKFSESSTGEVLRLIGILDGNLVSLQPQLYVKKQIIEFEMEEVIDIL